MEIESKIKKYEEQSAILASKISSIESELRKLKKEQSSINEKLKSLKETKLLNENKRKITKFSKEHSQWIKTEFEWSEKLMKLLKEKFKFNEFRPNQLLAINASLSKKDVLLVMATGGGKSLVYQLPTLVSKGFSLVISPLLALIQDQLINLEELGIKAVSVNSQTSNVKKIYDDMNNEESDLKLVYVTPEWVAKSKRFMAQLKKCYEKGLVNRVAIDEVHCCSTWGHDFRPDYGFLGLLRPILANVPFIGLTATASIKVLTDIQTMLNMEQALVITSTFNRPNLYYKVTQKPSSKEETLSYIYTLLTTTYCGQTGIIYANTISDCINLASDLRAKKIKVVPYHAQLTPEQKKDFHQKWLNKTYQIIVATIAFGMGIDKSDVRFVLHYTVPKSIESLYQESGRAGRDGLKAGCILMYSLGDYLKLLGMASSVADEKKILAMLDYCLNQDKCRRQLIANNFDENWSKNNCKMCDHCDNKTDLFYVDITSACNDIHDIIKKFETTDERLTLNKLLDGWLQTGPKKYRVENLKAPKITREQAEFVVSYLLFSNYLKIDKGYSSYSIIYYMQRGKNVTGKIEMLTSDRFLGFCRRPFDCDDEPLSKIIKTEDVH